MNAFSASSKISSTLSFNTSKDLVTFFEDSTYTIDLWRERTFTLKDVLRSYMLVEVRLYKNEFHVEHEFLLGEFRSPSHTIYVAVERGSRHGSKDSKVTREERDQELAKDQEQMALDKAREREEDSKKGYLSIMARKSGSVSSLAAMVVRDLCQVFAGADDFDGALELFMAKRMSRFNRQAFIERGSMKFPFDPETAVASSRYAFSKSRRPSLLHFTCAAVAAHRARLYYTAFEYNCFWFASAIMFILNHHFEPSYLVNIDKRQGTVKVGSVVTLTLGELKEEDHAPLANQYTNCIDELQNYRPLAKTGADLKQDKINRENERQLEETVELARGAQDKLAQADRRVVEARALRAKADLKVAEAKSKAERLALQADFEAREEEREREHLALEAERERERLALEAEREREHLALEAERERERLALEEERERERSERDAKDEQRERERLALEEQHKKEIQELQAQLSASKSSNSK